MPQKDPDERREYHRAYHVANGDVIRARANAWYANATPEQREAKRRQSADSRRGNIVVLRDRQAEQRGVRVEVIEGYGGECTCCGNDYFPHLTLDHLHGNGAAARREENQRVLYRRLRRMLRAGQRDAAFQILCWNCNAAKHHLGQCGCQH